MDASDLIVRFTFRQKRNILDQLKKLEGNYANEWGWETVPLGKENLVEIELLVPQPLARGLTDEELADYFELDRRELLEAQLVG